MSADLAKHNSIELLKKSGGSIQTVLSRTIRLNENSTLEREFISVIDRSLPLLLSECVGVSTIYKSGDTYSQGSYAYIAKIPLTVLEDICAVKIIFLTFDIWGNHVQTLAAIDISDRRAGQSMELNSEWTLYSEQEACEHYASIAYVAKVRTAAGLVLSGNITAVVEEAKRFSAKFTEEDMEPKRAGK
jgi:hypothetical protein